MILNLTPEEQERLSYVQGNTEELALIYLGEETVLEDQLGLEDEARHLRDEIDDLRYEHNEEIDSLLAHIRHLESKLSALDADYDSWFE